MVKRLTPNRTMAAEKGPAQAHNAGRRGWSPAERTGLAACGAALALAAVSPWLAALPLALFVGLCLAAPFFPRISFFFPTISRGPGDGGAVALTFDDGPDPATTPLLLDLLASAGLPATFFVTGQRSRQYPHLIRQILLGGHELGNHAFHHNRYRMFWQPAVLAREIDATQQVLASLGVAPAVFRPPAGIVTPAMETVLNARGMLLVNFSCRGWDGGNRRIDRLAHRILSRIRPGDIVLMHDLSPGDQARLAQWVGQVRGVVEGLAARGLQAIPLSQLIGRSVMRRV